MSDENVVWLNGHEYNQSNQTVRYEPEKTQSKKDIDVDRKLFDLNNIVMSLVDSNNYLAQRVKDLKINHEILLNRTREQVDISMSMLNVISKLLDKLNK